jgi:hypothetical protein
VADLDSSEFAVRERAQGELERLGEAAEGALRAAAKKPASAEVAHQVERLLGDLDRRRRAPSGDDLRALRALEVIERAGDRAARELLAKLAKGTPHARLTRDAQASLARLKKQPPAGK